MGGARGGGSGSGAAKGPPGGAATAPRASEKVWDFGIPDEAKTWNAQQFGDFVRDHVIQRIIDREARAIFKEMGLPLKDMRFWRADVKDITPFWGQYSRADGKITLDRAHAQLLRDALRVRYADIRREPAALIGTSYYYTLVHREHVLTMPGHHRTAAERAELQRIRVEKARLVAPADRARLEAQMRVQRSVDAVKTVLHEAIHALRPDSMYQSRAQKALEEAVTETLALAASARVLRRRGANSLLMARLLRDGTYPLERAALQDIAAKLGMRSESLAIRLRRSKNALRTLHRLAGRRRGREFERDLDRAWSS